ncbi:RpiB/LacA/LacB family sugar-phosphate isomerase [Xanthomarina sp. F2636L]|uniref:RpiB/LacA/LacB family sugar-phosphate isomerase n=1 Tax=Xanthomarina sp. F2636L TaxID=2996018 RepID=UPI00225E23C0|nr:RpiB/LacA/LacB family sugar-phosphate isomerase [Xanthomarina sp. F2636L]MCX7549670.1 RpiB/LacA/LacB family sugar-phosphate isomerase [Xanthomarina sp. F2636L]
MKQIGIISDNKSFFKKSLIIKELSENYLDCIVDLGTYDDVTEVDFESLGNKAANFINSSENNYCLTLDLSGNGISMFANKHKNINGEVIFNEEVLDEAFRSEIRLFCFTSTLHTENLIAIFHKLITKILA